MTVGRAGQVESGCVGFEHRGQSAHTGEVRMTALACEDGLLTAITGRWRFFPKADGEQDCTVSGRSPGAASFRG